MIKQLCMAISIMLLLTACGRTRQPEVNRQESKNVTQSAEEENQNWQGYYFGILPCDGCNGIKTWVNLKGTKKKTFYTLLESYDGENGKILTAKENAKWSKSDSIIYLKDKMAFVGDDFITFIENPSQMLKSKYTLERLKVFNSSNSTLFTSPKSTIYGTVKGEKAVRFSGVENIKNGKSFLSTEGTYVINCKAKTYDITRINFYTKSFAMGKTVDMQTQKNKKYLPIKNGSTFEGVFDTYCQNQTKEDK